MFPNRSAAAQLPAPRLRRICAALSCLLLLLGCASAQDGATVPNPAVPNLVKFSGTIPSAPAGSVGVIFALYTEPSGGAPLWQEVQNVTVDATGRYTSLLGSSTAAGIPLEAFSSNQARWLGVQPQGQSEQPRVLLVSVPYALKAADSETLGGLPASAFLRADALSIPAPPATSAYVNTAAVAADATKAIAAAVAINGSSTAGTLPVFADGSGNLTNSAVAQSGINIGIGTAAPVALLHLLGTNPTMRIEQYGPAGAGDSPNFNFYSGNGTSAVNATGTLTGDNLGQFAAAGYIPGSTPGTGSFPGSKVKVSFIATEDWNATSNGTAMTFQTTANTTTSRLERMRIDNTGNVGIGTPAPSALLEVNGAAKFDGLVTFASGQTFPGASVSLTSPDTSITVAGTATAPTVALNTSFTNALYAPITGSTNYAPATGSPNYAPMAGSINYAPASGSANYVATTGSTMTGSLSLPANGLQMANSQIVTTGGQLGYGAAPNSEALFDIGGGFTAPTYVADLLRLDGTVSSNASYAQAYLRGIYITPTYNLTQGYANYLTGVELSMAGKVGSNVAHSIVGFSLDGQPTGAGECAVGFGIGVPNQQTSLCNGTYGFYQAGGTGSAQYNYFGSSVGIGTPFPSALLEVNGAAKFDGLVTFASGQTFPGASVSITSPNSSITVAGTASAPTLALNTTYTNTLYAPLTGSTNYAPATGSPNYVATTGSTMTGPLTLPSVVGATGSALSVSATATQALNFTSPNVGTGSGNGGAINITAGAAGSGSGGSGGNLNLTAGGNMPLGGSGYSNLGAAGNVNITAGSGYNSNGGNTILASGTTSPWGTPGVFSKVSLQGGVGNTGDGATINVEGGHADGYPNTNGGNITLTAGNAEGGTVGGNIVLQPGTGSTSGNVGIGTAAPSALLEVNGAAKFDGLVTFASGQTFPGASVSITSPNSSITVAGTASAPTLALNTTYTNTLYAPLTGSTNYAPASGSPSYAPATGSTNYVATTGSTMTGSLSLPANGLQMANSQIVTTGGQLGYGAAPNSEALFDIGGGFTAPTYVADLLRLDGTVSSNASYAQAYLRGIYITPTYNLTQGYANYLTGVELSMAGKVGSNVAHSIVGFSLDGQPTGAGECAVGFGIGVPNQQTSLCNGTYGFYQAGGTGSAQYNYFGSSVGIGTPFPSALLEVNGAAKFDGLVTFASGQTFPGASVSITSPNSSITVAGTASAPTLALNTTYTNTLYAPLTGSTNYAPATGSPNYVATTGSTMTGPLTLPSVVGATGSALSVSATATQALNFTSPNVGTGSGNGGAINITAGAAGSGSGGSGGNLNLTAGGNMPLGGSGYSNLGAAGNVNITAGSGYNSNGGNTILASGTTSPWGTPGVFSKVSLQGGVGNTGDGATINVEGGHADGYPNTNGGNITLTAGNAEGGTVGGNIVLQPGTGSTSGNVTVQGNVQVNGNLNATGIQTNGSAGAIVTQGTPASSSAPCTPPQMMYDSSYVYTCVASNTWRRAASATF